ncbi:MAG: nucleoside deaminase [Armatimonadetes bacterium]|nr:nucleoside deaminase [Armatimonadota bacterium]
MKSSPIPLTDSEKTRLMREAIAEAQLGVSEGEAPIGCVIALADGDGAAKIVARGHNRGVALKRKNAHAEIIAFENAGSDGAGREPTLPMDAENIILVSTLEPCVMCTGAAMESGVSFILFGMDAPADNGTKRVKPPESPESADPVIEGGIVAGECRTLFVDWLKGKEGTEQAKFVEQLLALTETDGSDETDSGDNPDHKQRAADKT